MVSLSTWFRYFTSRLDYSLSIGMKNYRGGHITENELFDVVIKTFFRGKLTYSHCNKGEEMIPTIDGKGATLLVRKLPKTDTTRLFIGDVVVLKDPEKRNNLLVRRLAAIEGFEMVSKNEKEEPFVLEENQCWVLADNEILKPKEAYDSRIFGPVQMTDIVGRVIYCLQSAVDHGPIKNSQFSMAIDFPVLAVELDVDEMAKSHKA